MFVNILINCKPMNPKALWDKYQEEFSEDVFNNKKTIIPKDLAIKKAYAMIANMYEIETGKPIETISGMPKPEFDCNLDIETTYSIDEHKTIGSEMYKMLNEKQRIFVDRVLKSIKKRKIIKIKDQRNIESVSI